MSVKAELLEATGVEDAGSDKDLRVAVARAVSKLPEKVWDLLSAEA